LSGSAGLGPLDRFLVRKLAARLGPLPLSLELWDGSSLELGQPARDRLRFRNRRALLEVALVPDSRVGEAYREGRLEVEGDLARVLREVYRALGARASHRRRFWSRPNSRRTSRDNVHHHYDLGNDFYRLWLDEQLLYTCAYFPDPETPLEQAQIEKMDRVCRKLWLRPGESVVEAGSGWGSFALHMARRFGVRVRAYNVSREQIRYARQQAERSGLGDRVEFVEDDYRAIGGRYDAFVSLGMLEHVGPEAYPALAAVIDRALPQRGGRGLLHFIGRDEPGELNAWIRRRIFPGAYPPTLSEAVEGTLRPGRFSVLDVENLRLHYARTLSHWFQRFDRSSDRVTRLFDEAFTRTWRLYLAGSQAAFETGTLQLFQVSFARATDPAIPWSRDELLLAPGSSRGER
jgi:cyclopropane-fatty-acyl-phospholipid synthase